MPVPILAEVVMGGISTIPYFSTIIKVAAWLAVVFALKAFFGGASNRSERMMHSKVVMITGGTSGIGASVARSLAQRGAQIILLTQHPASDPFLVDYVDDLRVEAANDLIYAEQVDLSCLHSIRLFATKWVDNAPPRRLDMVILCASTMTPPLATTLHKTRGGMETNWAVNYLANFHLLSILSPAIRAQPPDRDVRVIMGACASYIGAHLDLKDPLYTKRANTASKVYGASKLALMIFAQSFQKHLDAYQRPDKQPVNARVIVVDPGWTRTPGMRSYLTAGSLWGLFLYLVTWPIWWLVLKSPDQGAQSFLRAAMEAELGIGVGGRMIKECREVAFARAEVKDEKLGQELWNISEEQITNLEKEMAVKRALAKEKKEVSEEHGGTLAGSSEQEEVGSKERKAGSRRSRKAK